MIMQDHYITSKNKENFVLNSCTPLGHALGLSHNYLPGVYRIDHAFHSVHTLLRSDKPRNKLDEPSARDFNEHDHSCGLLGDAGESDRRPDTPCIYQCNELRACWNQLSSEPPTKGDVILDEEGEDVADIS
jgi:hypothetical protein